MAATFAVPSETPNLDLAGGKPAIGDKSCIQDLLRPDRRRRGIIMTKIVKLRLNQQQLELIDRTIAQGVAVDREALVRLALREYAAARKADAIVETAR